MPFRDTSNLPLFFWRHFLKKKNDPISSEGQLVSSLVGDK